MDPDGLTILLFVVFGIASLFLFWRLGLLLASDTEKDQRTLLGFSDRATGHVTVLIFSICVFTYASITLLGFALGAVLFLVCMVVFVVLFSLGYAKGGKNGENVFYRVAGTVISTPAKLLFRTLGVTSVTPVTEEELLNLADDAEEQDVIDEHQKEMIANIVEFHDVMAGDIMTHRTELVAVEENTLVSAVVELAANEGVSRLPVYRKTLDEIVGILHIKDLLSQWGTTQTDAVASVYMRRAMFVPEACRARELLVEFKSKHTQIAVVVDEYGGTSGLVTMEDILEEIVGNIQDEFDHEEEELLPDGTQGFIAAGSADLEDVFRAFALELPLSADADSVDFDTVGGLVADRLGRIPKTDEDARIIYGGIVFRVMQADERRILKVSCTREIEE